MSRDSEKTRQLLRMIQATREQELSCDKCLGHLAELAETELQLKPLCEALHEVSAHLDNCPDCAEHYAALRSAMETLKE